MTDEECGRRVREMRDRIAALKQLLSELCQQRTDLPKLIADAEAELWVARHQLEQFAFNSELPGDA